MPSRSRLIGYALAVAVVAGAPRAHAEGTGVIAAQIGSAARGGLADALVAAIGARGRVVGDAVAEAQARLAAGAVPAGGLAGFRQVRAQIDDGWRAYLRAQLGDALATLAAARRAAEPLVALAGGAELYADATLRLGVALQARQSPEAAGLLALAIALDPARPITIAEFSPDVVSAVDAVRAAPPGALARLHIRASPAGAAVTVDGRAVGPAPVDVELARGEHLVVVRAPAHRAAVERVTLDGERAVELALAPDAEASRLAAGAPPGLAPEAAQALVDVALRYADLDDVVVATIAARRGGSALLAQRCAGAPARCTAVVEIGYADGAGLAAAAREAWAAVQVGALVEPPRVLGEPAPVVRPPDTGCRLCRNPLVWTGVGAAVVGAVVVGLVISSGSRPAPVVTIDGHDFGR